MRAIYRVLPARVTAENAVGSSDPSPPSELVSISTDQEATEPHFLRELRDAVAVEGQKVCVGEREGGG